MGCEVLSVLLCWGLGWRWKTEIALLKSTPVPPPRRKGPGQLCHAPSLVALLLSHLMLELVEIWSDATPKSFLRWHWGWLAPWGVPFPLGPLGSSSQPRSLCPPALFNLPVPCPGLGEGERGGGAQLFSTVPAAGACPLSALRAWGSVLDLQPASMCALLCQPAALPAARRSPGRDGMGISRDFGSDSSPLPGAASCVPACVGPWSILLSAPALPPPWVRSLLSPTAAGAAGAWCCGAAEAGMRDAVPAVAMATPCWEWGIFMVGAARW